MARTPKLGGDPDEDEDDERDPTTGVYKVIANFEKWSLWNSLELNCQMA